MYVNHNTTARIDMSIVYFVTKRRNSVIFKKSTVNLGYYDSYVNRYLPT